MPTEFKGEVWYTLREAADALGKHTQTLKNWIYAGTLNAKKVGNAYQVAEKEIERIRNGGEPTPVAQWRQP